MAAYPGATTVTTELIQRYLDENKALILAILDNQQQQHPNPNKLNETAQYQLKLQQNLMYLAAIADAQPQPPLAAAQVPPATMMQPGQHYMQQQQHMMQQSMLGQRNPMQYMQQTAMHPAAAAAAAAQQQQVLSLQAGMVPGAHNGMHMLTETGVGGNGPAGPAGFPDFGRGNPNTGSADGLQTSIGLGQDMRSGAGNRADMGVSGSATGASAGGSTGGDGGASGVQAGDDSEPSYLKASEDDGN